MKSLCPSSKQFLNKNFSNIRTLTKALFPRFTTLKFCCFFQYPISFNFMLKTFLLWKFQVWRGFRQFKSPFQSLSLFRRLSLLPPFPFLSSSAVFEIKVENGEVAKVAESSQTQNINLTCHFWLFGQLKIKINPPLVRLLNRRWLTSDTGNERGCISGETQT